VDRKSGSVVDSDGNSFRVGGQVSLAMDGIYYLDTAWFIYFFGISASNHSNMYSSMSFIS
jgi:hypothetical protein